MFGGTSISSRFSEPPSTKQPWMLQFGGHHLALNITIAGSKGVLTPTLTGAQPALFKLNGKTIRPIGRESDKALALLQALDETQRKQAVLGYQVADLVLGPGQDGKKISPEGLKASSMNTKQQAMLLDVIAEWTGILTEPYADERMSQLKQNCRTYTSHRAVLQPQKLGRISMRTTASRDRIWSSSTLHKAMNPAITCTPCTAIRRTITEVPC